MMPRGQWLFIKSLCYVAQFQAFEEKFRSRMSWLFKGFESVSDWEEVDAAKV